MYQKAPSKWGVFFFICSKEPKLSIQFWGLGNTEMEKLGSERLSFFYITLFELLRETDHQVHLALLSQQKGKIKIFLR